MFNSIGGNSGIGSPISPNQIGGEGFIRHIGADKLIFRFKEGSGTTVRDDSHNSNNGTFGAGAAAPTWRRNSLYFDGGDYVVLIGINHGISTGGFTFCSHLDVLTGGSDYSYIYDQQTNRMLIGRHADIITFYAGVAKELSSTGISVIKPIVLQITRNNSGNLEAYINGAAQGKGQSDTTDVTYDGTSIVASGSDFNYLSKITSTMYSFRILNKGLSGIETQQIYLSQKFKGNN